MNPYSNVSSKSKESSSKSIANAHSSLRLISFHEPFKANLTLINAIATPNSSNIALDLRSIKIANKWPISTEVRTKA